MRSLEQLDRASEFTTLGKPNRSRPTNRSLVHTAQLHGVYTARLQTLDQLHCLTGTPCIERRTDLGYPSVEEVVTQWGDLCDWRPRPLGLPQIVPSGLAVAVADMFPCPIYQALNDAVPQLTSLATFSQLWPSREVEGFLQALRSKRLFRLSQG